MYRRIIVSITIVCVLAGCTSTRTLARPELEDQKEFRIHGVLTTEEEYYEFPRGAAVADSVIAGNAKDVGYVVIPLDDVKVAYIQEFDKGKTCALGGAIGLLFVIIGAVVLDNAFEGMFDDIIVF